jgi:Spy/CpxP family protein refolding chaperone
MRIRAQRAWCVGVAVAAMLSASAAAFAQTPPPTPPAGGGVQGQSARGPRGGGRAALPPITPNMNQQQLQAWMDTYALVQAERELLLTADQYPNFVARLRKLQDVRRRQMGERRRILTELGGLLQGAEAGRDEAITARVTALDEGALQTASEVRRAYQDLDAVLTPWQRGRFRTFEEQLERRKVELLAKIGGGK